MLYGEDIKKFILHEIYLVFLECPLRKLMEQTLVNKMNVDAGGIRGGGEDEEEEGFKRGPC